MTLAERLIGPVVGISVALSLAGLFHMWAQDVPIQVYERHADKVIVSAGETARISWSEIRTAECSSRVYRQLITADGKIIEFEPVTTPAKPIGPHSGAFEFTVPPLATPGVLTYRVRSEFICNPIQRMLGGSWLPLQDIKFEYVLPMKGSGYEVMDYTQPANWMGAD